MNKKILTITLFLFSFLVSAETATEFKERILTKSPAQIFDLISKLEKGDGAWSFSSGGPVDKYWTGIGACRVQTVVSGSACHYYFKSNHPNNRFAGTSPYTSIYSGYPKNIANNASTGCMDVSGVRGGCYHNSTENPTLCGGSLQNVIYEHIKIALNDPKDPCGIDEFLSSRVSQASIISSDDRANIAIRKSDLTHKNKSPACGRILGGLTAQKTMLNTKILQANAALSAANAINCGSYRWYQFRKKRRVKRCRRNRGAQITAATSLKNSFQSKYDAIKNFTVAVQPLSSAICKQAIASYQNSKSHFPTLPVTKFGKELTDNEMASANTAYNGLLNTGLEIAMAQVQSDNSKLEEVQEMFQEINAVNTLISKAKTAGLDTTTMSSTSKEKYKSALVMVISEVEAYEKEAQFTHINAFPLYTEMKDAIKAEKDAMEAAEAAGTTITPTILVEYDVPTAVQIRKDLKTALGL